jgi:hypothetical protein
MLRDIMQTPAHTETPPLASDSLTSNGSANDTQGSETHTHKDARPWILRPGVRATIYGFLVLFLLATLAWGIIPRLLDPTFEKHIQNKEVMVGMTREQVLKAWGSPYQTNVTHTKDGIRREEWIYEEWKSTSDIKHRYLYFEEGILVGGWY